jgi:hypothetical protein
MLPLIPPGGVGALTSAAIVRPLLSLRSFVVCFELWFSDPARPDARSEQRCRTPYSYRAQESCCHQAL